MAVAKVAVVTALAVKAAQELLLPLAPRVVTGQVQPVIRLAAGEATPPVEVEY